jgi:hypothetical protein
MIGTDLDALLDAIGKPARPSASWPTHRRAEAWTEPGDATPPRASVGSLLGSTDDHDVRRPASPSNRREDRNAR